MNRYKQQLLEYYKKGKEYWERRSEYWGKAKEYWAIIKQNPEKLRPTVAAGIYAAAVIYVVGYYAISGPAGTVNQAAIDIDQEMVFVSSDPYHQDWKEYRALLDEMKGEKYGFLVRDIETGLEIAYNEDERFYSASSVKGPYVISVVESDDSAIQKSKRIIDPTIQMSDNSTYKAIRQTYGHQVFADWLEGLECEKVEKDRNYVHVTPYEMANMWTKIYEFFETESEGAEYCKGIFEGVFHSFLSESLGEKYTVYSKAGWIAQTGYMAENDVGLVMDPDHPYVISVLSTACGKTDKLGKLATRLDRIHEFAMEDAVPQEVE